MNRDELIELGKSLGIKQAPNMKESTLIRKIKELEAPKKESSALVILKEGDSKFLDSIGFDFAWLDSLSQQYSFDKFEYMGKFQAFRCYSNSRHLDWVDVNDLSLLNGGRPLCKILLKHQPLSPTRQVIKYNWR